jgi:hypothetical protein
VLMQSSSTAESARLSGKASPGGISKRCIAAVFGGMSGFSRFVDRGADTSPPHREPAYDGFGSRAADDLPPLAVMQGDGRLLVDIGRRGGKRDPGTGWTDRLGSIWGQTTRFTDLSMQ